MRWRTETATLLGILALGAVLYGHTLDAPFMLDDERNILQNPQIRLRELRLAPLAEAAFGGPLRRPVAYLSLALNYRAGGYDTTGYHLVNIGIHLVSALLVYALALVTLEREAALPSTPRGAGLHGQAAAAFAALLFVAHPVQIQAVTYVIQRMTSLAVLFYLLALLLYVHGRMRPPGLGRWGCWAGGAFAWLLALGSKEIAVTLPFVVWLYEWYFFQDLSRGWLRRRLPLLLGLALAALLLVFVYAGPDPLGRVLGWYDRRPFTLEQRLLTELRVVVLYLSLLFLPLPGRLNLVHDVRLSGSLLDPPTTLVSLVLLLGLAGAAVWLAPRRRLASFCILWFLLQLVLESSFVPLELVFEHRLYLPSVGFALLAGWLLFPTRRVPAAWRIGLAAGLIAALGVATWWRNETWRDAQRFWEDATQKSPQSVRARVNLGVAYMRAAKVDEAIQQYQHALRLDPQHPLARTNLGLALVAAGRAEEAAQLGVVNPEALGAKAGVQLHRAVQQGNREAVALLLKEGAPVDARSQTGRTPLHVAARRGDATLVALLLAKGADPNARARGGVTPLHLAARAGHVEVMGILLRNGAHPDVRTRDGRTPLDVATEYQRAEAIELLRQAR